MNVVSLQSENIVDNIINKYSQQIKLTENILP